jgi:hypothetical protein
VFENRVLRIIFGPKKEEMVRGRRRLHSEELHNFHASQNIIRVMKSRIKKWAGRVARMEKKRNVNSILVGRPEEKRRLGRLDVDGKIILEWILGK